MPVYKKTPTKFKTNQIQNIPLTKLKEQIKQEIYSIHEKDLITLIYKELNYYHKEQWKH